MNPSSTLRCPTCGSLDYRRSHSHGLLDALMAFRHRKPMRCRHCGRRFYQAVPPPQEAPQAQEEENA